MMAASVFARRTGVAAPLLLVALGIAASYLPSTPVIHLEPEIILAGVLPAAAVLVGGTAAGSRRTAELLADRLAVRRHGHRVGARDRRPGTSDLPEHLVRPGDRARSRGEPDRRGRGVRYRAPAGPPTTADDRARG